MQIPRKLGLLQIAAGIGLFVGFESAPHRAESLLGRFPRDGGGGAFLRPPGRRLVPTSAVSRFTRTWLFNHVRILIPPGEILLAPGRER